MERRDGCARASHATNVRNGRTNERARCRMTSVLGKMNACVVFGERARALVDATTRVLRERCEDRDATEMTTTTTTEFVADSAADVDGDGDCDESFGTDGTPTTTKTTEWTLDTRYYVARVHPVIRGAETLDPKTLEDERDGTRDRRARAVVLACGTVEEFERAKLAFEASGDVEREAETRIVAYDSLGSVPEVVREWVLDQGFEAVRVRLDDANADAALTTRDDDGESHGVRRVIEALESTVWGAMELKPAGEESDLGREMRTEGGAETSKSTDVDALAALNKLLGDDDGQEPIGDSELHARVAALYDAEVALKAEERLEKLADILGQL